MGALLVGLLLAASPDPIVVLAKVTPESPELVAALEAAAIEELRKKHGRSAESQGRLAELARSSAPDQKVLRDARLLLVIESSTIGSSIACVVRILDSHAWRNLAMETLTTKKGDRAGVLAAVRSLVSTTVSSLPANLAPAFDASKPDSVKVQTRLGARSDWAEEVEAAAVEEARRSHGRTAFGEDNDSDAPPRLVFTVTLKEDSGTATLDAVLLDVRRLVVVGKLATPLKEATRESVAAATRNAARTLFAPLPANLPSPGQ